VGREERGTIRVLLVEDDETLRETCSSVLRLDGYDVTVCDDGERALGLVGRRPFDIVLVDLFMTRVDGMQVLAAALASRPETLVIVMTGNPTVESSIEALRAGAWDYLPKPFSAAHLQVLVGRAAHTVMVGRETGAELRERGAPEAAGPPRTRAGLELLGSSPAFRRAIELAARVAPSDASVFITGESGSGKELVAQFIHANSRRATRPFVAVNCAALPETLLESEMFGHRKGAFTGAVRDKAGLLETANGGTLFLDELIELPKSSQAKLLRVIQDGVVRRLGSEETDAVVNVRFIAATNGDVEAARESGAIREDLYYRLRVVPIHLPPLRERTEDIPILADYFLGQFWKRRGGDAHRRPELTAAALEALAAHPWRGNVRELQNVIEHVAVLAQPGAPIGADQLPLHEGADVPVVVGSTALISTTFDESYHVARERVLSQFELQYLGWLVKRAEGNLSEAARIAGVDRTTLYRVMDRHGLHRPHGAPWTPERNTGTTDAPDGGSGGGRA
jgi:DNA-binding NtrC family response regulator